jgi:murein DD-endopeptidase MepM/ murein hydrolase activator NlpD
MDTEIIAPERLKVKRAGYNPNGYKEGYVVAEGLESGFELKFIHVCAKVAAGDEVERGSVVALSDGSGTLDGKGGTAPHLHFELWDGESWGNGHPVNPSENGYLEKYIMV